MMRAPLVSVVMAVYEGAPFLEKTLDSIFSQTYPKLQVIAVDDGSKDGTWDMLKKYPDRRLEVFRLATNQGPPAARNVALSATRGDLITFFDSDDLMYRQAIERRVDYLLAHPSAMAVYGHVHSHIDDRDRPIFVKQRYWVECGRKLAKVFRVLSFNDFLSLKTTTLSFLPFLLPTLMIRRVVFKRIGLLNEQLKLYDDVDYALRLWRICDLHYLDVPVFKYRFHKNSFSADLSEFPGMGSSPARKWAPLRVVVEKILKGIRRVY